MDIENYVYPQLENRHIRLLKASRDDDMRLRCHFLHVPLDTVNVDYLAISYTWGDPTPVSQILCDDGRCLYLTASAADILTFCAVEKSEWYFWIDLLCINQQDLQEKAHQVPLMGEVYAAAWQVVAWLGKPTEDSDLAMDFVHTLWHAIRHLTVTKIPITKAALCESPLCEFPSPRWTALRKLLQRPWFERMWVVQEVVMATDVVVLCGDLGIKWVTLATVCVLLHANYLSSLLAPVNFEPGILLRAPDALLNIEAVYGLRAAKQSLSLQAVLTDCVRFNSTDPRDKVYAVMGMVNNADDPQLYPNYNASSYEVFTSWARHLLTANASLRVLHLAGVGSPRLTADLPSWVSDWSARHDDTVLGNIAENAGYRASGSVSSHVEGSSKPNMLVFKGILLDTVTKRIYQPSLELSWRTDDADIKDYRSAVLAWIDELSTLIRSSPRYDGSDKDVLWRTLIGDLKGMGYPADNEQRKLFESWLSINQDLAKHGNAAQCSRQIADESRSFSSSINMMGKRVGLWSRNGLIGLGPPTTQIGDILCIILGAHTPFLLRENAAVDGQSRSYQLVGECYMHGLMHGEGLDMGEEQNIALT